MAMRDTGRREWVDLPDELVYHIAQHCSLAAIATLAMVDRRTRGVCLDDRLWEYLYRRDYGSCRSTCGRQDNCPLVVAAAFRGGDILSCALPWLGISIPPQGVRSDDAQMLADFDPSHPHDAPVANADADALHVWQRIAPWKWWTLFDQSPPGCVCWWPPDASVDHRWAYASLQTPGGTFARFPDMSPRRVGRTPKMEISDVERGSLRKVKMIYRGESDDKGRPHGRGMAIAVGRCGTAPTAHRISGHWTKGKVHGWAATWRGNSYFQGHYQAGRRHGPGLLAKAITGLVYGRWENGLREGAGIARTPDRIIRYGAACRDHRKGLAIVRRRDGSLAFVGRIDYCGEPVKGRLYDECNNLIYKGDVPHAGIPRGSGTVYTDYGVAVTVGNWTQSPLTATLTYGGSDALECMIPAYRTISRRDPIVVHRFTYSTTADPDLAGMILGGSWQTLAIGPVGGGGGIEIQDGGRQLCQRQPQPSGNVVVQLFDDSDINPHIKAVRSLCDVVFWPRSDGTATQDAARNQFLDYMARRYGGRWATCREVAHATGW
jgi:hypothetical protein